MPQKDDIEGYLKHLSDSVEPKTHCCECTPGDHFERHVVHIQYPDCSCKEENFVLRWNADE